MRNGAPYLVQVQGLLGVDGDTYLLVCFSEPVDVDVLDAIKSSLKPHLATAIASYRAGRH